MPDSDVTTREGHWLPNVTSIASVIGPYVLAALSGTKLAIKIPALMISMGLILIWLSYPNQTRLKLFVRWSGIVLLLATSGWLFFQLFAFELRKQKYVPSWEKMSLSTPSVKIVQNVSDIFWTSSRVLSYRGRVEYESVKDIYQSTLRFALTPEGEDASLAKSIPVSIARTGDGQLDFEAQLASTENLPYGWYSAKAEISTPSGCRDSWTFRVCHYAGKTFDSAQTERSLREFSYTNCQSCVCLGQAQRVGTNAHIRPTDRFNSFDEATINVAFIFDQATKNGGPKAAFEVSLADVYSIIVYEDCVCIKWGKEDERPDNKYCLPIPLLYGLSQVHNLKVQKSTVGDNVVLSVSIDGSKEIVRVVPKYDFREWTLRFSAYSSLVGITGYEVIPGTLAAKKDRQYCIPK